MKQLNLTLNGGKKILVQEGTILNKIVEDNSLKGDIPVVLGSINGKLLELTAPLEEEGNFEVLDIRKNIAMRVYVRTLQFVLIKAVLALFPEATITIEHAISKGLFGEIHKELPLTEDNILSIKDKMQELIERDIPIHKISVTKEKAIKIFTDYKMTDKLRLLKHVNIKSVKLYELDGLYDYFYGSMAYSTGVLKVFNLNYYDPGFILRYPTEDNPYKIPEVQELKKLFKIFYETEKWGNILDVGDVGALNDKIDSGEMVDTVRVAEAFHEKKIASIADKIRDRKDCKIVLIAGPSSSGKTTFARRLGIQLRVNGLIPISISLDDYFVNRELIS